MNLKTEMESKTSKNIIGNDTGAIDIDVAIHIAKQYAEEMCKKQVKLCCKRYYDATMADEDIDLEDTQLATEAEK